MKDNILHCFSAFSKIISCKSALFLIKNEKKLICHRKIDLFLTNDKLFQTWHKHSKDQMF